MSLENDNTQQISPQEFHQLDGDKALLKIDVRTLAEIDSEHYAGCIDMPLQQLNTDKVKSALTNQNGSDKTPIYLVCGSGMRAQKAAKQLSDQLINPLIIVSGGIQAIKAAGIPTVKGRSSIISLERQVRIAAGSLVLVGAIVGTFISPLGYGLSAFVGAGLIFAGITDTCAMGMLIARLPWNGAKSK